MQRLPTAEQLSGEQMQTLLQTVAESGNPRVKIVQALCTCTAASRITADFAMKILVSTLKKAADRQAKLLQQSNTVRMLQALCELPAAQQLPASEVLQLLRLAVEAKCDYGNNPITILGCSLPAAKDLSSADVAQLLKAAVAAGQGTLEVIGIRDIGRATGFDVDRLLDIVVDANDTGP